MDRRALAAGLGLGALAAAAALHVLAHRAVDRFENLDPDTVDVPGQRFWIRGVAVHYRERGQGFPVVLVHGFAASTYSFRYTAELLAPHFRVISVDLPGFGYSGRPADFTYSRERWVALLHEFLERLVSGPVVLVGHSLGGSVAQRYALRYPEQIARLVLVGSPGPNESPTAVPAPMAESMGLAVQALVTTFPTLRRRLLARTLAPGARLTPEVLDGYVRPLRLHGTAAAVRSMFRGFRSDPPVDISQLAKPTLLLWGTEDRVVKLDVARRLQREIPGARLEVVPDAGHMVLEEQPALAGRLLLDFIQDLAAPGATAQGARA